MVKVHSETIQGSRGDLVCRSPQWTDVAKFFLVNYGLHAVTVVYTPGARPEFVAYNMLFSLLCPLFGMMSALAAIFSGSVFAEDKLTRARRAGALYMLVPWELNKDFGGSPSGWHGERDVHGQLPFKTTTFQQRIRRILGFKYEGSIALEAGGDMNKKYALVPVPKEFKVYPLINEHGDGGEIEISCQYSVTKSLAAIFQILYGSFELYAARVSQIEQFGYAAYSFTVIPYIMMSFMNLLATLCRPTYHCVYLVHYGGDLHQAGQDEGQDTEERPDKTKSVALIKAEQRHDSAESPDPLRGGKGDHGAEEELAVATLAAAAGAGDRHEVVARFDVTKPATPRVKGRHNQLQRDQFRYHMCQRELQLLVSCAVGCAHRDDTPKDKPKITVPKLLQIIVGAIIMLVFSSGLIGLPYLIMYFLSDFDAKKSTKAQRGWIVTSIGGTNGSLIICLMVASVLKLWRKGENTAIGRVLVNTYIVLLLVPSICMFVVVGQMIMQIQTCVRI